MSEAQRKVEEAKTKVIACEQEMQKLKKQLREIGTESGSPNTLTLVALKVSRYSAPMTS